MSAAAAATNMAQPTATTKVGGGTAAAAVPMHLNKKNLNYVLLLFLVVGVAFVQNIPPGVRKFSQSLTGSIIGIGLVYAAYTQFNWPTALMTALFVLLCMSNNCSHEGFEPNIDTRFVGGKAKWYVEQILGENPLFIEVDNVKTMAVQDDTSGRSRSGHNHSGSNF